MQPDCHRQRAGNRDAIALDHFQEHAKRAYPETSFTVKGPIDHDWLESLGVRGHTNDFVLTALEVPVTARFDVLRRSYGLHSG
jgi:hypothetical protein